jgi:hypothetical protein
MNGHLRTEWAVHQRVEATRFVAYMRSRGRLVDVGDEEHSGLRTWISSQPRLDQGTKAEMLKDVPVLEAAIAAHRIIVSCDGRARNCFASACIYVTTIGNIVWVSPILDEDDAQTWLQEGATDENGRRLSDRAQLLQKQVATH